MAPRKEKILKIKKRNRTGKRITHFKQQQQEVNDCTDQLKKCKNIKQNQIGHHKEKHEEET